MTTKPAHEEFADSVSTYLPRARRDAAVAFYEEWLQVRTLLTSGRGNLAMANIKKLTRLTAELVSASEDPKLREKDASPLLFANLNNALWESAEKIYSQYAGTQRGL